MKKNILLLLIIGITFIGGYSVNNFAISKADNNFKIAVVDIQEIAMNSSELNSLKKSQEKQLQEIQLLVEKAKTEISKETDSQKALQIEENYRKQINDKKLAMDTEYNKQLTAINNKIKTAVAEKAHSYSIVLSKNAVLFGGDDITSQVINLVK